LDVVPDVEEDQRGGRIEAKEERAATVRRKRRMERVIRVEWGVGGWLGGKKVR
jgi:hypothetical protein